MRSVDIFFKICNTIIIATCAFNASLVWSQEPSDNIVPQPQNTIAQKNQAAEEQAAFDAAAEKKFKQAEVEFNKTIKIQLYDSKHNNNPDYQRQQQITKKAERMANTALLYMDIVRTGKSPKWGLASLTRLGMMYQDVADQLIKSPVPAEIPEDVKKPYTEQITDFAMQFYSKAADFYHDVVSQSTRFALENDEFVLESKKRLSEIELNPAYIEYLNQKQSKNSNSNAEKSNAGNNNSDIQNHPM